MERKRNNNSFTNITNLYLTLSFFLMLLISTFTFKTSTATTISCLDARKCPMFAKAKTDYQKYEGRNGQGIVFESKRKVPLDWARRFLGGPGSSPPQCTSKCGKCTPCRPVHVPVPPGTPVTAEYYPEAWRCKCGNKLNMP
ncbi:hypothetical protein VNO77_43421 [Canavalia gladiata]|uniref:Epidermal patterning factor-like protein n=1 Tax=Canavalia gladiata TaxID=3824 RepID=A0AAN9JU68_CANGL